MAKKHKLISNSLAIIFNRLTQGIATFILSSFIARSLGANQLGQYILAISYYYIFVNIISQGLKTLFTREIAKEPESTSDYLVNGSLLQLILSIIGYAALVLLIFLLPYSPDTSNICYIMGLSLIPFALSNITEAIFQAQEQMFLITISTVPVYILRLLLMIWVIKLGYSLNYVASVMVASEILVLIIQWLLLIKTIKINWKFNKNFIIENLKASKTFFAIESAGIIAGKIDIVLLSLLGNEFLIGLNGSIIQLILPFSIISNSVALAAFPNMSKARFLGKHEQRKTVENILEILLLMALPFATGLLFIGGDLLLFIYQKPEFYQASLPLKLIALTLILSPFSKVLSYALVATGFEKINLIQVIITTTSGALTGILLIPKYKLIGSALMLIVMSSSAFSLFMYAVYTRLYSLNLWRVFCRPLLISCVMIVVFLLLKGFNMNLLYSLLIATCTYLIFIGFLSIKVLGGLDVIKEKLQMQKNR